MLSAIINMQGGDIHTMSIPPQPINEPPPVQTPFVGPVQKYKGLPPKSDYKGLKLDTAYEVPNTPKPKPDPIGTTTKPQVREETKMPAIHDIYLPFITKRKRKRKYI